MDRVHEAEDALVEMQVEMQNSFEAAAENLASRLEQCEEQLDGALRRADTAEAERDVHFRQLKRIHQIAACAESPL